MSNIIDALITIPSLPIFIFFIVVGIFIGYFIRGLKKSEQERENDSNSTIY